MKTKAIISIMLVALMLASCAPTIKINSIQTAFPSSTFTPAPQTSTYTPTSENTVQDFHFGDPVENDSQAQIAAQSALRASFDYAEPLTVIKAEKMSYGEYTKQIGQPLNQSADLQVWFVLYYNDNWKSNFTVPSVAYNDQEQITPVPLGARTPQPPFRGCVYVAVNAENGSPVEVGGPLSKGILTDCDK